MRAPPALLLPLLALALAHAARALSFSSEELLPRPPKPDTKTIYDRGDSDAWYDVEKKFYMADGQCHGVIKGENLPCRQPERLWVDVQYDVKPPAITISHKLDHVEIRRQPSSCKGLVEVYVKGGGCLIP